MEEFERILRAHRARYPRMEPQDYVKLAFQSEFGPEHMLSAPETVLSLLRQEWEALPPGGEITPPEPIGGGLCRYHLSACTEDRLPRLAEQFCRSAREHRGSLQGLELRLESVRTLDVPGMEQWLAQYQAAGYPPVRHSESFRTLYAPHYRVLRLDCLKEL